MYCKTCNKDCETKINMVGMKVGLGHVIVHLKYTFCIECSHTLIITEVDKQEKDKWVNANK